jgi:hypothetical protein
MFSRKFAPALLAGPMCAAWANPALAQQSDNDRFKALEARLGALDAEVSELRSALAAERARNAGVAAPAPLARPVTVAAAPAATVTPPLAPVSKPANEGTSVKLSGFFKTVATFSHTSAGAIATNTIGRDFYVPGAIPIGGRSGGTDFETHAKQTRIVVAASTPVGGHTLSGLVETDFQTGFGAGNQRIVNAYNPALRRAFLQYDGFLAGQEWTNFQYIGALPETTDYLGPSEGTVFVRQAQIRYTTKLTPSLTLAVAAENPATMSATIGGALMENDTDRLPDGTARLTWKLGKSELSLAGLARKLTVSGANNDADAGAWGASVAGKLVFGPKGRHDLRFMATHGTGIGRYVGLNLVPDAILVANAGRIRLEAVDVTAGFAALRFGWTGNLRSTVMGSYQTADYPTGLNDPAATRNAWSGSANLFYSPIKPVDLGIEVRHGRRELVSGAHGVLDRFEMVAKYSF